MDIACWLWSGGLFAAAAGWLARTVWASPYTPSQTMIVLINVGLARILWRAELPATLPLKPQQGAVIIANHRSSIDPFFIQVSARRRVHWLAAAEFAQSPIVAWLYRFTGAIPVQRSGRDTAATKQAIRLASNGGLIGMFPEGSINTTTDFMIKVRPGAIMIALKANVPVLPCYIEGSPYRDSALSPLCMPAKVRMRVGSPIDVHQYLALSDEKSATQQATIACVKAIAELAGQTDFEPVLAGRRWLDQPA